MRNAYHLLYKGVLCTAVDWDKRPKQFVFVINNKSYIHDQLGEYDCSADTDHIRCVIEEFLDILNYNPDLNQKTYNKYRREDAQKDKKQNAAYWDTIDRISEAYIKQLLKHSYPAIDSIDDGELIEIGKFVTEFTIEMLESRCKANFPVVDGEM